MVTLYERLCHLCKQKGVSGGKMCADLGLSRSVMSDLKSGRKKGFNAEIAQKIALYFGVSVAYLLGEEENGIPYARKMVKKLAEEQDLPFAEIEEKLGVSYTTFRSWYNGSGDYFSDETQLAKIAEMYGVSVEYLLGKETDIKKSPSVEITEGEQKLLDLFRRVPENQRQMVLQMIEVALNTKM